jgi:hypothetical protein
VVATVELGQDRTHRCSKGSPLFDQLISDHEKGCGDFKAHTRAVYRLMMSSNLLARITDGSGRLLPSEDASGIDQLRWHERYATARCQRR